MRSSCWKEEPDIHAKDKEGYTALISAMLWHGDPGWQEAEAPEKIRALLEKGASVNAQTEAGKSALMLAAKAGSHTVVEIHVDAGTDVEARDCKGRTVLDWAQSSDRASKDSIVRLIRETIAKRSAGQD